MSQKHDSTVVSPALRHRTAEVICEMRFAEFAALWEQFSKAHRDYSHIETREVLNGLPIEALKDWAKTLGAKDPKP